MLSHLVIHNFAIIDSLELDFPSAMTVITGETGAGKSIAIDALGLALGDRADASMVRHGAKRSEIIASFNISLLKAVQRFLLNHELDNDSECILRRTISAEGGSRAYINGRPVPLQMLKELSEKLIDIHSQHQHQSLLRNDNQRELLDNYGQLKPLADTVQEHYLYWKTLNQQFKKLENEAKERAAKIDFLQFQIAELTGLDIRNNEWFALDKEQKLLANAETIQQVTSENLDVLQDNDKSIVSQLEMTIQDLEKITDYTSTIKPICTLLNDALINITEATAELRQNITDEQFDSEHFSFIETRMATLLDAARKHRCEPDKLLDTLTLLQSDLEPLLNAEDTLSNLASEISIAKNNYDTAALNLTTKRKQTAKKLKTACQKILKQLGMGQSTLEIKLLTLDNGNISQFGNEKISFEISTNPGNPTKPLAKVASGGELSRISLAIQVVTASITKISTLVFDEVDVGIGGGVAEVVGKLLHDLGKRKQIVCITHQAQVAAQGQTHWLVEKQTKAKTVRTSMTELKNSEREIEIARMIGGIKLTTATQRHAKEMLKNAQSA